MTHKITSSRRTVPRRFFENSEFAEALSLFDALFAALSCVLFKRGTSYLGKAYFAVKRAARKKLFVSARCGYAAVIQHDYAVGLHNGAYAEWL